MMHSVSSLEESSDVSPTSTQSVSAGLMEVAQPIPSQDAVDVRGALHQALPGFIQPVITLISGKPYQGERPRKWTAGGHVLQAWLLLLTGIFLSAVSLRAGAYWAIPIGWAMTLSCVRKLQVVIMHHCSHRNVFKDGRWDSVLGTTISIVLVVKAFWQYRKDHALHHSNERLLTASDETIQFLTGYSNLAAGLPKRDLWRRLLIGLLSPFFHLRWLLDRLSSCFCSKYTLHNLIAFTFWGLVLWGVGHAGLWLEFVVAYVIPATLLYNISATLRLAAEHRFPDDATLMLTRDKRFVCRTTVAVFLASPPPAQGSWVAWLRWSGEMAAHLLARVCVLVGDTPCHDFHHRHPNSHDWVDYIHARDADAALGAPGFPEPYLEEWGLIRAIDCNLKSMSLTRRIG
ncbi:hypothetical protein [Corallococcus sp. CA047B]|uniref:hypothetical protein n=1 Tax=Corallococcus sp. CA047B TaxID=2316729 RepID=UPI0011C3C205|nr:hypothetical protein [Corallococcus sp. CA047B]